MEWSALIILGGLGLILLCAIILLAESWKSRQREHLLKDTWLMIHDATNIDFSNGNVYAGVDEGHQAGWAFYAKLQKRAEKLGVFK